MEPNSTIPQTQHIGNVFTSGGSQGFVGYAGGDVIFGGGRVDPADKLQEKIQTCRNALFLTDPEIDRASLISAKGRRVAGTCEWIQQNEVYQSWLQGANPLLWIRGGPGKGKTMISIYLTEELAKDGPILYYFCTTEDDKRNNAITVLRGLLWQIMGKWPDLAKHVLQTFDTPEKTKLALSSRETLWSIFAKCVHDPLIGRITCLLDGLDECDEDSIIWLIGKLDELNVTNSSDSNRCTLRLVLVSRDIAGLQMSTQIKLDPDNNENVSNDVRVFVSTRVQQLSQIVVLDENFQRWIEDLLLERAENTFLWVGFAMRELLKKKTQSQLEETVDALPKGLPALYARMLLQIEPHQREMSSKILQWVTLAARPLSLQELAIAIGCHASHHTSEEQRIRDLLSICEPIVRIDDEEQSVGLVHQSARDYLLRQGFDNDTILEKYRIKTEELHLEMADFCIGYITMRLSKPPHSRKVQDILKQEPFLEYAMSFWPDHAKQSQLLVRLLIQQHPQFFGKKSPLRHCWWLWWEERKNGSYYADNLPRKGPALPLLHLACRLGIFRWAELIIERGRKWKLFTASIRKRDFKGNTPLHHAAEEGSAALARLLLDQKPTVDSRNLSMETPLHVAAEYEQEAIVRLLLEHGANPRKKDDYGSAAIHTAAFRGSEAMVCLLLDYGADVHASDEEGDTALHCAALRESEAIVRLLLDRGADIHARDNEGSTALHSAAEYSESEAIVRLLLDRGADIHTREEDGKTALHCAARAGSEAIVRLLLDRGADIHARTESGRTTLHLAALIGLPGRWSLRESLSVMALLLQHGVDVHAKDNEGKTAREAHQGGLFANEEMTRLLLDAEADANT